VRQGLVIVDVENYGGDVRGPLTPAPPARRAPRRQRRGLAREGAALGAPPRTFRAPERGGGSPAGTSGAPGDHALVVRRCGRRRLPLCASPPPTLTETLCSAALGLWGARTPSPRSVTTRAWCARAGHFVELPLRLQKLIVRSGMLHDPAGELGWGAHSPLAGKF
jgi:hypothetical protein